jgi:SAM-dependent methyltransferase
VDLKEVDILGADVERHWYYSSKAKAMENLLGRVAPARILDVGAGSGFFSRHLLAHTSAKEAWCVDISYKADFDGSENDKPVYYRRSVNSSDADLVLLMDVLEHVDDDVALLQEYAAKVPPGTRFLISVPAFMFLWSGHDEFLEHRRRYTLPQLEKSVRDAGLTVRRGIYRFALVFPIAAIIRLAQNAGRGAGDARSQLTRHRPSVNASLKALCDVELSVMRRNRIAGLTVFCLAEKI